MAPSLELSWKDQPLCRGWEVYQHSQERQQLGFGYWKCKGGSLELWVRHTVWDMAGCVLAGVGRPALFVGLSRRLRSHEAKHQGRVPLALFSLFLCTTASPFPRFQISVPTQLFFYQWSWWCHALWSITDYTLPLVGRYILLTNILRKVSVYLQETAANIGISGNSGFVWKKFLVG